MILLIDNYDSFSYNLVQLIGSIDPEVRVIRNDEMTAEEVMALNPSRIILSPGPGRPEDAGICEDVVRKCGDTIPILGVCLGHQAICQAYGGTVTYAKNLMHGKQSKIKVDGRSPIFLGLPQEVEGARYHSLALAEETLPKALVITAVDEDGEVMAVSHVSNPVHGLQFHPESILTPMGKKMIMNFLEV